MVFVQNQKMENNESVDSRNSPTNCKAVMKNENRDDRIATMLELSCKKPLHEGTSSSSTSGNGSNSHKMGSRRIFTPQFKLQVLESYRNDNDCKGNQRATARKYNIHRRQIQKWLQCETSLRSSVANINQNTVKHQFHNINMHQQQQQQTQKSSINVQFGASGHQHGHLAAGHDAPHNSIIVPPMSSGATNTTTTQTQDVLSAANLAAVVAMTITNKPSSNGSVAAETAESVPSALRPSSIIGACNNASTAMSPLLHHHHHHHYGIPAYIHHTPATVQLPLPILAHHIPHQQHHTPYQYHNLAYTQALTHQSSDKQQSSFMPSMSLPEVSALSAAATRTAVSATATTNGFPVVCGSQHIESVESKKNSENVLEPKRVVAASEHKITYPSHEITVVNHYHPAAAAAALYQFKEDVYAPLVYPLGPMDLSLRTRKHMKTDLFSNDRSAEEGRYNNSTNSTNIVDLTHRKRKVSRKSSNSLDDNPIELSEKQQKLQDSTDTDTNSHAINTNNDEDEVEIEVGTEEKIPSSKPVKLFKPYLLDDYVDSESSTVVSGASTDTTKYCESVEASPWTRYTASLSPPPTTYDVTNNQCQGSTFQFSTTENLAIPSENTIFPAESKTEVMKSAFTSIPTISPTSFRSPKGSPSSSGYESSSSTYSDSSFCSRGESHAYNRTFSLTLQMQSSPHDQLNLQRAKHVERWLEHESRPSSESISPIAILA
ncbi:transcriptional repressor brinker [Haematobia irritans]|uniref:transcriptional repressor brinker n=1 Tax=Haematobia irritans TaxID=7368 RepID=UPI003F508311